MCGIVGVIGANAAQKAFDGLKALEYRGYDSWGIAAPQGNSFYLERHVGKIGDSRMGSAPSANLALGHTRWATHGRVSEKNAHPHLSNDGTIAIVHNGIVENFEELKSGLLAKGYRFNSDTDSEVIANLIQENLKTEKNFPNAVRKSILLLEGSFAIAAMRSGENEIVCARDGSPLVLGVGMGEFFVASDATAFIRHTKSAVFLEEGHMAVIGKDLNIFSISGNKKINFSPKTLQWDFEQAKKGEFAHFMLKEIHEQPQTIIAASEQPEAKISEFADLIRGAQKIYFAGCGSSYHACLYYSAPLNYDSTNIDIVFLLVQNQFLLFDFHPTSHD